ncbi:MAG: COR domain-containing protein [Pseudomonadota bacterium]
MSIEVTRIDSYKGLEAFAVDASDVAISPALEGVEVYLSKNGFRRLALCTGGMTPSPHRLLPLVGKARSFAIIGCRMTVEEIALLIAHARELKSLLVSSAHLRDEHAARIATGLPNLTSLTLSDNSVGEAGARAIAEGLPNLTSLDLLYNSVGEAGARAILDAFQNGSLRLLMLEGNPCTDQLLTKEAFESADAKAILAAWAEYLAAAAEGALAPLNEAKLLVLGDEAVGKTSLARFLIDRSPRDPDERKTPNIRHFERIETRGWTPTGSDIRLNVWDFGGQEIMRGTHRYFLTERSLYLVVLEDRREDDESIDTWMRMIRTLAGDVPVLVVINKCDGGKADLRLDEPGLQREYPQILGFHRMSCNDDAYSHDQATALRAVIANALCKHPAFEAARMPQPASWLAVKDALSVRAREESVLESAVFDAICVDPGVVRERPLKTEDERRGLLRTLHAMGVVVAHGLRPDAPVAMREITLLDPNWLTDAIYAVLDRIKSEERGGRFTRADLSAWLDPQLYPVERHEFIISMMLDRKVELCYRLSDEDETYLAPEALRVKSPDYSAFEQGALRFRYRYEDLPRALVPRLIVRLHDKLLDPDDAWLTGAKLRIDGAEAVIRADREARMVDIAVKGQRCREALAVLREAFASVHDVLGDLGATSWTPMPDNPNVEESYEFLLRLEDEEGADYRHRPTDADHAYSVRELLDLVDSQRSVHASASFAEPATAKVLGAGAGVRKADGWLTYPVLLPCVSAVIGGLTLFQAFDAPLWALTSGALIIFVFVHSVLRIFDRNFFFRRLLYSWLALGGSVVVVTGFSFALDLEWLKATYGTQGSDMAIMVWFGVFALLLGSALWEGVRASRS